MIDVEGEEINIASLVDFKEEDGTSKFGLPKKILTEALEIAEIYADTSRFTVKAEKFQFTAVGKIGDMEYDVEHDDYSVPPEWGADCQSFFANGFLKNVIKFMGLSKDAVMFHLCAEKPLIVDITLPESGKIMLALAPRVEEEEDGEEKE
jgi:hypothetical protein